MADFIANFGINWKVLIAQAVNFFLLVFILSKLVYKPLLQILSERRRKIQRGLDLTQEAEIRIVEIDHLKTETLTQAKQQALSIISEGELRGKDREQAIVDEASHKVDAMLADAKTAIAHTKSGMEAEFRQDASQLVRKAVEKVLAGSLTKADNDKLIEQSLNELAKN